MQKMCMRTRTMAAMFAMCTGLAVGTSAYAVDFPETESNNNKSQANAVTLAAGDSVSGTTTGTSTTSGAGNSSSDYFRVKTTAQPLAIYRHQLALTSNPASQGFSATIRGLSQSGGVIGTADNTIQTASSTTSPARAVVWYGFGKEEEIFYRVQGGTTTTGTYTATLSTTTVTPTVATGTLYAGLVSIGVAGTGTFALDSDIWLYDSNYDAIAGAGNDDIGGSGTAGPSAFTRTLAPGTYTLAVTRFNLANNQASPVDDDFRAGSVMDFANSLVGSQVNPSGATSTGTANVTINDGANPAVVTPVSLPANTIGDVQFVQFTLLTNPNPAGVCTEVPDPVGQGNPVTLRVSVTPAPGSTLDDITSVVGNIVNVTGNAGDTAVAFTRVGVTADWEFSGTATSTLGAQSWSFTVTDNAARTATGSCSVTVVVPPPANDTCGGAIALTEGVAATGTNVNATATGDGPSTTCGAVGNRPVWYSFTPATSGNFQIDSCGTNYDTLLAVFTSPDCVNFTFVACDDDSTSPGPACSPAGTASKINSVALTGGTTYLIRHSGFSTNQGPYTLTVTRLLPTGSCCVGTCCTVTSQAACTGTWTEAGTCSAGTCGTPANDLCSNAIPVSLNTPVATSNCGATNANDGPAGTGGDCDTSNSSIWYTFTPSHTAAYRVDMCGSAIDTELAIFTTDCITFTQIACDDDATPSCTTGSTLGSRVDSVVLTAGTTYHVRLGSFDSVAQGNLSLLITAINPLGACCTGSVCTSTDGTNCGGGVFTEGGVCSPNPCAPATGACCCGSTCSATTAAACAGTNQIYRGDNSVCNVFGTNNTAPCCFADYNQSSTVTVQDIFDFLAAYFGAENCADINASGAPLSVQDIFDFLGAYFAGCV